MLNCNIFSHSSFFLACVTQCKAVQDYVKINQLHWLNLYRTTSLIPKLNEKYYTLLLLFLRDDHVVINFQLYDSVKSAGTSVHARTQETCSYTSLK